MFIYAPSLTEARRAVTPGEAPRTTIYGTSPIPGFAVAVAAKAATSLPTDALPELYMYYRDAGGEVRRLHRASLGLRQADIAELYQRLHSLYASSSMPVISAGDVRATVDDILDERRDGRATRENTPLRELSARAILEVAKRAPEDRREIPDGAYVPASNLYGLTSGNRCVGDVLRGTFAYRAEASAWLSMWCSSIGATIMGDII